MSRSCALAGALRPDAAHSTITPAIVRFRKGTSTRAPGTARSANASGTRYVKVERIGTGSATSQVSAAIAQ
jgi:hypothetical protein